MLPASTFITFTRYAFNISLHCNTELTQRVNNQFKSRASAGYACIPSLAPTPYLAPSSHPQPKTPPTDPIQPVSGQLSDWRSSRDRSHPIPDVTTGSCGMLSSFGVLSCSFYLAVYCVLYLAYHRLRMAVTRRRKVRSRYSQKLPPV